MENSLSYRLSLDEGIELLERFNELYKTDNKELWKVNHDSDIIIVDNGQRNLELLAKLKI